VFLRRWARIQRGRARCDLGEKDGIVEMREALEEGGGSAGGGPRSYLLTSFAEACGVLGRASEGLAVVEEAIEDGGERFLDAERQRLRGDLLLASVRGRPSSRRLGEAEACYARAIEIGCAQHAPSLELRAVTSLARLWRTQGRADPAVALLREALGRFTEGADTADLREASSLLRELGGRRPSTARRSGRRGA
jgi:adenylate cyclase